MKGKPAIYLGRIVDKKNFRTFIYDSKGEQQLVESWKEFESCMQSGVWFATKEEALSVLSEKQKPKRNKRVKKEVAQEIPQEDLENDEIEETPLEDLAFEVKNDDFLPK